MAYDSERLAVVLFGSLPPGETWELRVSCRADFNEDGEANSQDLFDFLTAFFAGGDLPPRERQVRRVRPAALASWVQNEKTPV